MSLVPEFSAVTKPPLAPRKRGVPERILSYRLLWVIGLTVFVLDQVSKLWILRNIPFGTYSLMPEAITVIDGFFYIIHVGNTGAAWSMFSGQSFYLALLALVTLVAIFFWRESLGLRSRPAQAAFGLLCGGIVGNLIDRLLHGHVIDFLDFHFGNYIYPTFNIADAGICIGVFTYIIWSFKAGEPPARAPRADS